MHGIIIHSRPFADVAAIGKRSLRTFEVTGLARFLRVVLVD